MYITAVLNVDFFLPKGFKKLSTSRTISLLNFRGRTAMEATNNWSSTTKKEVQHRGQGPIPAKPGPIQGLIFLSFFWNPVEWGLRTLTPDLRPFDSTSGFLQCVLLTHHLNSGHFNVLTKRLQKKRNKKIVTTPDFQKENKEPAPPPQGEKRHVTWCSSEFRVSRIKGI